MLGGRIQRMITNECATVYPGIVGRSCTCASGYVGNGVGVNGCTAVSGGGVGACAGNPCGTNGRCQVRTWSFISVYDKAGGADRSPASKSETLTQTYLSDTDKYVCKKIPSEGKERKGRVFI